MIFNKCTRFILVLAQVHPITTILNQVKGKYAWNQIMRPNKQLPASSGSVEVVLLDGGGFTTTDDTKIHADGHDRPYYLYDWCFYVYHKPTGRRILWDLGISDVSIVSIPFHSLESTSDIVLPLGR